MAFPNLQVNAPLTIPWAEYVGRHDGIADSSMSASGAVAAMTIIINWTDLPTAIQQCLGYSERITNAPKVSRLSRHVPFQHPYWPNLWCTRIISAKGLQFRGKILASIGNIPSAPTTQFQYALLSLEFSRPPYPVLTDAQLNQVATGTSPPQEYLRYTDRFWHPSIQMLSREGMTFVYKEGLATGNPFPGSVGTKVVRAKLKRTWYQIPEAAIYNSSGFPTNLITNPTRQYGLYLAAINNAGAGYAAGDTCIMAATGFSTTDPVLVVVNRVGGGGFVTGFTILGMGSYGASPGNVALTQTSTSGGGNGNFTLSSPTWIFTNQSWLGSLNTTTFMGLPPGTALLEDVEIVPQPLQMPANLMNLMGALGGETYPLQYNVTFHIDFFDPPIGSGAVNRGHNNMPWSGDSLWYRVGSRNDPANATANPAVSTGSPPFFHRELGNLFQIL
jgi:hypothetical protein